MQALAAAIVRSRRSRGRRERVDHGQVFTEPDGRDRGCGTACRRGRYRSLAHRSAVAGRAVPGVARDRAGQSRSHDVVYTHDRRPRPPGVAVQRFVVTGLMSGRDSLQFPARSDGPRRCPWTIYCSSGAISTSLRTATASYHCLTITTAAMAADQNPCTAGVDVPAVTRYLPGHVEEGLNRCGQPQSHYLKQVALSSPRVGHGVIEFGCQR